MILNRRKFFIGAGALIAAPAIVRASSLMPVKAIVEQPGVVQRFAGGLYWYGGMLWVEKGGNLFVSGDEYSMAAHDQWITDSECRAISC